MFDELSVLEAEAKDSDYLLDANETLYMINFIRYLDKIAIENELVQ